MPENVRVVVVDDSAFARLAISRELQSEGGISVVDIARNGNEALEKITRLKPDVVTMDVEMPGMDGLAALERIMDECPVPVIMLSSLTSSGSDVTVRALELGAVDFFLKHGLANPVGGNGEADTLRNKIVMASKIKVSRRKQQILLTAVKEKPRKIAGLLKKATNLVVIGSSTGGPKALYQVVPGLPGDIPAAILIIQHMPPGFTNSLANRLDQLSNVIVKEAEEGDLLHDGVALVAKGGYHMTVEKGGVMSLNQGPTVCGVRPSVNVTMQSAAPLFGKNILGVILTGMGCDGTLGCQFIKLNRGRVIVEDESTCVVWGMPKSVQESGYADKVIPLTGIADGIVNALKVKA
ncbi:MAG: chemotaxis response regulator protein-glutamate methylesterase [Dehalococcoidales bacterium]|nr:chemotaxis response regulator protein-glutamate methylesterase [Dehalococcoidales bacterium]